MILALGGTRGHSGALVGYSRGTRGHSGVTRGSLAGHGALEGARGALEKQLALGKLFLN
jgi:hypothetical protein